MFFKNIPVRFTLGIMIFLAAFINYMMRVNMSVIIIAMVKQRTTNSTSIRSQCEELTNLTLSNQEYDTHTYIEEIRRQPSDIVTFDWTQQQQAYILSAYFWGYTIGCLLGGMAAERWGSRKMVFVTMLIITVLNILCPLAARLSYIVLIAARVASGAAGGFLFPAVHVLVVRWVPPDEKGKFVSASLGGSIGTVVTWSLTGLLIENLGWEYAFYIPGTIAFCWCILWWFTIYDTPDEHPTISDAEKVYIKNAIGDKVDQSKSKIKVKPPFKEILTSSPYLAMVVLLFGSNWGVYFFLTAAPMYMSRALGFNLSSSGMLASLPYLLRMVTAVLFGHLGDRLVRGNIVSLKFIRKFFCLFSHIVPGILLVSLGYTGCSPYVSVALISLSLGSNGSATLTNLINHQDLAPNFAGTLFGIANCVGQISGFTSPLVTAHFTQNGNGFDEWRPVFMTGASVYIATGIYFIIFGSAETQPWNYIVKEKQEKITAEENVENIKTDDTAVTISAK